jgi:hypothetical protein
MSRLLIVLLAVVACGQTSSESSAAHENSLSRNLVGAWDASLSLSKPYPLALGEPKTRRICGTIGFVENHQTSEPSTDDDRGVYDLDLSSLGLGWLDAPSYPIAVARSNAHADNLESSRDSVAIVLNPGSNERIVLLGRYDVGGINGKWTAQSARGTALGVFLLSRHTAASDRGRKC